MVNSGKPSSGCQNCRSRHIKCDETRPECRACLRTGRSCPGYRHPLDVVLRGNKAFSRRKQDSGKSSPTDAGANAYTHALGSSSSDQTSPTSSATSGSDEAFQLQFQQQQHQWGVQWQATQLAHLGRQSPPIPPNLALPLEASVMPIFFNSYLSLPRDPQIPSGFMELLPHTYSGTKPGSHLHLITLAVSTFSVAAWTGQRSLLRLSERFFMKALPRTREALQGDIDQNLDEIVMTIMLLSTYEEFYAMKNKCRPTRTHLQGAVALISSRRRDQFESPFFKSIAHAVQTQIIKTSLGMAYPTIQTADFWPFSSPTEQTAPCQLATAASQLVDLRQGWQQLSSQLQPTIDDINQLLFQAFGLENHLRSWEDHLPSHWKPIPATNIPESVRKAGIFNDQCDCYPDLWVASTWNFYRYSRIAVHRIILNCLALFPKQEDTFAQTHSSRIIIQALSADICATVPFFLGSQTHSVQLNPNVVEYPEAEGHGIRPVHRQTAPLLGGWFAMSYLSDICSPELELGKDQMAWIEEQMRRVLQIYTFSSPMEG